MNYLKYSTLLIFLFISPALINAQSNTSSEQQLSLDSGSIDNQFEYVIQKSNRYRDERGRIYKVVRREWLYTLKAHTIDSIKAIQDQLDQTKSTVTTQQKEIDELKTNLSSTQSTLEDTNKEKDSMALFGLQMSKLGYNTLMWSIIAGLFALLLFFIFKFKNSNAVTKAAKRSLEETELEFEEHRKIALEREQKVRRQLQDEINKQKGIG
ncbi:MAG: tRNA (guanine-N1)-methyltransferase [Bacteroidia bacterium]|nr:tRNA (guanine-N1)-methyltransferase [Bacteroidia bacterium]NND51850.1 tRNA (guanine-N1)-methyltransferase [Flavobacteriaceae bacterium]